MVKQKRNVTGTAEFTGFSAFASHTSSAAAALQLAHQQAKEKHTPASTSTSTSTSTSMASLSLSGNKLRPNPIYAGNDTRLHQIFKRITKKDSITKSRALAELADFAFPCDASDLPKHVSTSASASASTPTSTSTPLQKNEQVVVLAHFFYLFANKLIHDNNSSVRSEAMKVFGNAMVHVPKACNALLRQDALDLSVSTGGTGTGTAGGGNVGAIGNVIGWTYSFQSCQVMEVVRASKKVWSGILSTLEKFQDANTNGNGDGDGDGDGNSDDVERFVKQSIVSHVESILQASSRATNLAEALSVSAQKSQSTQNNNGSGKGGGKGKGKGQSDNSTDVTGPSDSEKEEIEERYERVVLLTLRATASLFCEYPEGDGITVTFCYHDIVAQPNILWKHLNSAKGNFRRATFALVSCIAQNAASLIHDKCRGIGNGKGEGSGDRKKSNLSLLLLNILSSERDPANFAALFEMILLFIASFRNFDSGVGLVWESRVSDEGCCMGMDPNVFVKSMSKALKRACYGSPSTQWAPTMLPIIVTLQSPEQQLQVLSSLWHGRTFAVGAADSMAIVAAVAECAMYLLVQQKKNTGEGSNGNNDNNDDEENQSEVDANEIAMDMSQIFLDCLTYYLTVHSGGSASVSAEKELSITLIRDLHKLDTLPLNRDSCKFSRVRSWFWSEGISSALSEFDRKAMFKLSAILDGMNNLRDSKKLDPSTPFQSALRDLFWNSILPDCDSSPNAEQLSLMRSLVKFCNVQFIFDMDYSAGSFCQETLVPWIVNLQEKNKRSLNVLFDIFFLILNDFNESEEACTVWKQCLSEVVETEHSLSILIAAINILFAKYNDLMDTIRCSEFDVYATGVAKRAEAHYQAHAAANLGNDHLLSQELSFLQLSTGLSAVSSSPLVSIETIHSWIDIVLSHEFEYGIYSDRHVLLEIIVSYSSNGASELGTDLLLIIVLRAWKEGGRTWESNDLRTILSSNKDLRCKFLSASSHTIKEEIQSTIISNSGVDLESYLWADRATRALDILHQSVDGTLSPTAFVGLDSTNFWTSSMTSSSMCEKLYLCFMYLLQKQTVESDIMTLIEDEDSCVWTLHVFMVFVCFEGSKTRRCENFAHLLSDHLSNIKIELCIYKLIDMLVMVQKEDSTSTSFINRAIVVLDWLVSMIMPKFCPAPQVIFTDDSIDQCEIKEGDELWYITDGNNANSERVKAKITKVHTDDLPNLYFTIACSGGESSTKQTIATRLKRHNQVLVQNESTKSKPADSNVFRLEDTLVTKLVKPLIQRPSENAKNIAAEVLNIIISSCGLQGKSGIGTTRFDVFQIISRVERDLVAALSLADSDPTFLKSHFECFSIMLGFGMLTSRSHHNCEILKYDGDSLLTAMEESSCKDDSCFTYGGKDGHLLRSAIMRWSAATSMAIMNEGNASCMWNLMHIVSSKVVSEDFSDQFLSFFIQALEGLNSKMAELPQSAKATTISSEQSCTSNFFKLFASWDASPAQSYDIGEYWVNDNMVPELDSKTCLLQEIQAFVVQEAVRNQSAIAYGARLRVEDLLTCLSSPKIQWCAFHALITSARKGDMFYSNEDVDLSNSTKNRLDTWTGGLDEEEAIEIEEDVFAAAQWLPHGLMSDLEIWKDDPLVHDGDQTLYESALATRLLKWILCLEYFDSAGNSDMRNRAHISSYIEKTGAVKEIFDAAVSFSDLSQQEPADLFDSISISSKQECFSLPQISTLAIFRSIELMPTLCKNWWNDECPRYLQIELNKFVETMVAPETLRRELERINRSSALGDLEVSGSCVSREVVATYLQDECKLSVLIRIPSSFPFRNAEVDCQKTLGISEKRWRYWSLQIMRQLNGQDGSILDALLLWKQNVDKEFDGVEPCPVCYSVLCVKTHAMPNLECKTCHNRFHSGCLYKWFNSSGKNQCVLCQQPWSGSKII